MTEKKIFVSIKDSPIVADYVSAAKKWENSQYVSYRNDWKRIVKKWSAVRPSRTFLKKNHAISYAKKIASNQWSNAVVISKKGRIS